MNKKEAWTPGPWHVSGSGDSLSIDYRHTDESGTHSGSIATVDCHRGEMLHANARLISAAPELVEALRALEKIASRMFAVLFEANIQSDLHHAWADEINRAEALLNRIGGR